MVKKYIIRENSSGIKKTLTKRPDKNIVDPAKCDLLQRAVGQVTEQSICLFSQYFYFEKYVVLGKSNHLNSDESKSQRQENLIDFESPF